MSETPSLATRARRPGLFVAGGLLLLGALYLGVWTMVGPGVPRGTTVAGVAVGGLSPAEAEEVLDAELAEPASGVEVVAAGRTLRLDAERAGLAVDVAATVELAGTRSWHPVTLVRQLLGREVAPVVVVDGQALDRALARVARRIDTDPRLGGVRYEDLEVVATMPRPGERLLRDEARELVIGRYVVGPQPVELPVDPVEPAVTAAEVSRVAAGPAVTAIDGPARLRLAGETIVVPPRAIAASLRFVPEGSTLVPRVRAGVVRDELDGTLAALERPAVDAAFDVSSGRPVVVPAQAGQGVANGDLATAVVAAALESPARTARLRLTRIPAELTTKEARLLGVSEVISTFTQDFPYAAYRVTNIGVAAEKMQGTLLQPGDTFSLNGVVGERTPENGFVKGYIIVGNRLVEDYGGAVSTITTAAWHTAFFAGMTRVEQRAHGFWIPRYTPGLEATVSWGNLDLKFRNDTPYGVLITTRLTDTSISVTMWSTKYWDVNAEFGPRTNPRPAGTVYDAGPGCVPQTGIDGFDIVVTRVWSRNGDVKRREPLATSYSSAPTVICAPPPQPARNAEPKPSKSPKND